MSILCQIYSRFTLPSSDYMLYVISQLSFTVSTFCSPHLSPLTSGEVRYNFTFLCLTSRLTRRSPSVYLYHLVYPTYSYSTTQYCVVCIGPCSPWIQKIAARPFLKHSVAHFSIVNNSEESTARRQNKLLDLFLREQSGQNICSWKYGSNLYC